MFRLLWLRRGLDSWWACWGWVSGCKNFDTHELFADFLRKLLGGEGVGGVAPVDDALGGRLDVLCVGAEALVVGAAAAEGTLRGEHTGHGTV